MTSRASAAFARPSPVLADLLPGELVRDLVLVFAAAGLIGALAQLSVRLPGTPVPVTGQTLGVLLASCALGQRRALGSTALYAALGLLGLPWFANHSAGWQGASTGYLLGFILAAAVVGFLAERGADRSLVGALSTMLAGEVAIYLLGVGWLALDLHVTLVRAIALGFSPFLIGDALKMLLAATLLPMTWRLLGVPRQGFSWRRRG